MAINGLNSIVLVFKQHFWSQLCYTLHLRYDNRVRCLAHDVGCLECGMPMTARLELV